jgi:hypothetical protein
MTEGTPKEIKGTLDRASDLLTPLWCARLAPGEVSDIDCGATLSFDPSSFDSLEMPP